MDDIILYFFNRKLFYDRQEQCKFICVPNRTRNSVEYYDRTFCKYQPTFLFIFIRRSKLQLLTNKNQSCLL